jgi:hypothetical protein
MVPETIVRDRRIRGAPSRDATIRDAVIRDARDGNSAVGNSAVGSSTGGSTVLGLTADHLTGSREHREQCLTYLGRQKSVDPDVSIKNLGDVEAHLTPAPRLYRLIHRLGIKAMK